MSYNKVGMGTRLYSKGWNKGFLLCCMAMRPTWRNRCNQIIRISLLSVARGAYGALEDVSLAATNAMIEGLEQGSV